jgi:capsular exopolysaccharide synthesis family protein
MLMALALAGGIALGVACTIEFLRQPIETDADVQKTTGLLVLGSIGVIGGPTADLKGNHTAKQSTMPVYLPSSLAPAGIHIDLYRAIRATVETERLKTPFRSILVTSASPNEGKSTTVANLALVFQEFGQRVLMVEADLRRPMLSRAVSVANKPGLVDYLTGNATFDQICRVLPSGVTVIPTQVARGDTAAMLASVRAKTLLEEAYARFDLVLVDSSPLLAVPDNLLLVTKLDRVILVVKASATTKRDLCKAQSALQQANARILGVILNQANPRDVHYYSPRYRKYYRPSNGKTEVLR